MTFTTSVKSKVRNYSLPILTSLALAVSGYSPAQSYLPITRETRATLDQSKTGQIKYLENQYSNSLFKTRSAFNQAIVDGNFSLDEQRQVYSSFTNLFSLEQRLESLGINKFRPEKKDFAEEPEVENALRYADVNLLESISENLKGNPKNLETAFEKEALRVNIERADVANLPAANLLATTALRSESYTTNSIVQTSSLTNSASSKLPCCAYHYPNLATNLTSIPHERSGPEIQQVSDASTSATSTTSTLVTNNPSQIKADLLKSADQNSKTSATADLLSCLGIIGACTLLVFGSAAIGVWLEDKD